MNARDDIIAILVERLGGNVEITPRDYVGMIDLRLVEMPNAVTGGWTLMTWRPPSADPDVIDVEAVEEPEPREITPGATR